MLRYKLVNMSDKVLGFPEFHIMYRDGYGWTKVACAYNYNLARKIVKLLKEST